MAQIDNYLPCEAYTAAPASEKYPGFNAWYDTENSHYYFAVTTNKGRVVLRSEGYTTEAARDNGIESVLKNRDLEARYSVIQDEADGQWYVILKAGNHQEIARSCAYSSEASAQDGIKAAFSTFTERSAANKIIDNYLPCEAYTAAPASEKYPGFNAWYDTENVHYYFAVTTNKGRVVLRSEGYTTEAARDNGIESVLKNRDLEARYSVIQDETDGQWYVILKAGNHQEIARSCAYSSEASAQAGIKAAFSTFTERNAANTVLEDYLPCEAYTDKTSAAYPDFTAFAEADSNLHYFAMIGKKGNVLLRSEGYTTESSRNNGIESVLKNRDTEARYKVIQDDDGAWVVSLRAGNNQEIARSCPQPDEAAALAALQLCLGASAASRTAAAPIIEDYLPCEDYANKAASTHTGFTVFQDETSGLHYFAMVDHNGHVVLKSEGYTTENSRDNGIESVLRNRDIESRWSEAKDEEGYYMSLKAGNHQEIARTCHFESEGALLGWWMPFTGALAFGRTDAEKSPLAPPMEVVPSAALGAAALTTAAAAALIPEPEPIVLAKKEVAAPVVVSTKAAPVAPVVATSNLDAGAAAAGGGSDWWKWLLGLLLLAGLLFLLLRGCDGCNKPVTAVVAPPTPVAVDTAVKVAPTPVPAPTATAPTCNCTGHSDPLFNLDAAKTPKALHHLGTNPEFGNSHGLSPEQFFQKLQNCAKTSNVDKQFLDRVYKGMGYQDGFAAAKATQFSAVELQPGTVGNIGYSKQHKTLYARLDTAGKDLMAFRIKAANGCDFHFMKTCGNHFFFCQQ